MIREEVGPCTALTLSLEAVRPPRIAFIIYFKINIFHLSLFLSFVVAWRVLSVRSLRRYVFSHPFGSPSLSVSFWFNFVFLVLTNRAPALRRGMRSLIRVNDVDVWTLQVLIDS